MNWSGLAMISRYHTIAWSDVVRELDLQLHLLCEAIIHSLCRNYSCTFCFFIDCSSSGNEKGFASATSGVATQWRPSYFWYLIIGPCRWFSLQLFRYWWDSVRHARSLTGVDILYIGLVHCADNSNESSKLNAGCLSLSSSYDWGSYCIAPGSVW